MKNFIFALLISVFSVSANAVPMHWEDVIDFEEDVYFSGSGGTGVKNFSYTHDIKTAGFNPSTDSVLEYFLNISVFDDDDNAIEKVRVNLPGTSTDKTFVVNYSNLYRGFSIEGLAMINVDGLLDVKLNRKKGDFYLGSSEILAKGLQDVPAPTPLFLLGLALIGLKLARRSSV